MKNVLFWIEQAFIILIGLILFIVGIKTVSVNAGYKVSILQFDEAVRYVPLIIMGALLIISGVITTWEDILDAKEGRLVIK